MLSQFFNAKIFIETLESYHILMNFYEYLSLFLVTIARAIELKHSSSIVSALAHETAKLYTEAGEALMRIS